MHHRIAFNSIAEPKYGEITIFRAFVVKLSGNLYGKVSDSLERKFTYLVSAP